MLYKQIKLNSEVPYADNHKKEMRKVHFWRASFRVDTDYVESKDARGKPVLQKFPKECQQEFDYRRDNTKPRNHCGPIIKKQNSFVAKAPVDRPEDDADYNEFIKAVDFKGKDISEFIIDSLKWAQVDGFTALIVDHTNKTGEVKTLAQARADGDRYFLRCVKRDSIINMSVNDEILTEILIAFVDENGNSFVRYYNREFLQDFYVDENWIVVSAREPVVHGYTDIPVVLHRPQFEGGSQVEPMAELQQGLTSIISYMAVEIATSVYTLHTFTGETPEQDENGNVPDVKLGSSRIVYLGETGSLDRLGADTNAPTTLQNQIEKTEEAIYRTSGIASASPFKASAPQSGLSKIYDMHDLSSILTELAHSCQYVENRLMDILFTTMKGLNPADATYDTSFDIPDFMAEIKELQEVLATDIPDVIKNSQTKVFVSRNYQLTDEEQERFISEIEAEETTEE